MWSFLTLAPLPYAHRASATCRLENGDLDLVEVPVSSHPAARFSTKASFDPRDPRPDSDFAPAVYREIVDAAAHEMALIAPPVATLVILIKLHLYLQYLTDLFWIGTINGCSKTVSHKLIINLTYILFKRNHAVSSGFFSKGVKSSECT